MNTSRCFIKIFAGLAGFYFAVISPRHADAGETNAAASPATNGFSMTISASSDNYFGLPKEAFDRLSPEQITELAQLQKDQKSNVFESISIILMPVVLFTFIGVSVALGVNARLKRNRMLHETIRAMVEKGQPIPPELLLLQDPARRPKSDLRTGLVLIAVGIGVFFLPLGNVSSRAGLIPLFMGVAFLIVWKIDANKNGRSK